MRAAVFRGPVDLRLEDRPVPRIGPDEVLIRVAFCGICGSDLHTIAGMQMGVHVRPAGPRVLGHEVSGTVAEVGREVTACRVGDRVTCCPWVTCGQCGYCRRGLFNHCANKQLLGGSLAEYVVAPQGSVYQVPANVSSRRAALAEPLSCCVWAMDLAQIQSGSSVVVIGAGPMGLLMLLLARAGGAATTIVSEPNPVRADLARQLGATIVVDPREADLRETVLAATNGLGADVSFEAVGHPATTSDALRSVRNAGTIVIVGVTEPSATLPLSPYEVYRRQLTIRGCFTRRLSFERTMQWIARLDLDPVVTHVFPLADIGDAVECARQGYGGKILVAPAGGE